MDLCLFTDLKPNSYAYQIARQDALSVWFEKAVLESVNQETEELKAKVYNAVIKAYLN